MLTSTVSMFVLFAAAAVMLKTVSGQQDPLGTCMSLAAYQNPDNADAPLLGSCSVLSQDMPDCLTLTCTNTDSTQQIASFVVNFLPCGENGRKQAVRLTIRDFSGNTLLNRVFFDSESGVAIGQGTRLSVTIGHLPLGITFGVSYSIGGGDTFRLLSNQNIPLDSTEYACPTIPGLTQNPTTCVFLDNIRINRNVLDITCTTNPSCLSIRCTDRALASSTDPARIGSVNYYGINLLPCSNPPAMQIILANTSLMTQINVTLTGQTIGMPFVDTRLGNLEVTVILMITEFASRYVLTIEYNPPGGPTQVYFPEQTLPYTTDQCAPATNPSTMSPATNPAVTNPPFTTRQPDTGNIRLAGNTSPSTGRLEVFLDGRWGTVCKDNSFTVIEADVACQQLQGFGQSSRYGTYTSYVNDSSALQDLPIAMGNVACSSSSRRLQNCSFTRNPGTCMHSDDVGLECSSCSLFLCSDGKCVNACNGKKECNDGSDEDNIVCAISDALSLGIRIAIGIGVTILVLIIVIPISICVCVCMCTGACIAKAGSSGPRSPKVVATSYNPAPETLRPVV